MMKGKTIDATKGPLIPSIFSYAMPIMLAILVQSLFHSVDIAVLGNMADSTAVASVGASGPFVTLALNAFLGLSSGNKTLISRLYGAKDEKRTRSVVDTSLLFAVSAGVVVAVVGIILAPTFLRLLHCPADCFDGAVLYTRIYLASSPMILFYNAGHAVIAGSGDTKRPLYYILVSGLLNVVMNIVLCLILPQKVLAVAISTALSQALSAILMFRRLCTVDNICRVTVSKMRFHLSSVKSILRFGLPVALTSVILPISNMQIQSAINTYGVAAVAGNSASSTLEGVVNAFSGGFASTASVFVSQNLGAQKTKRAGAAFLHCSWISILISAMIGILFYFGADLLLPLILTDDLLAIEYAKIRMMYVVLLYFLFMGSSVISHTIQAYGYAIVTTLNSIVSVFLFRIIWMELIYPRFESFECLMISFPVSQLLMTVFGGVALFFIIRSYHRRMET